MRSGVAHIQGDGVIAVGPSDVASRFTVSVTASSHPARSQVPFRRLRGLAQTVRVVVDIHPTAFGQI